MSIATLIAAALIVAAALPNGERTRRRVLIAVALLLPPIGLIVSGHTGNVRERTRVDIQFVGMRVPLGQVLPCGARDPLTAKEGVWIGGGSRSLDELTPDTVALPGYRSHLVELCTQAGTGGGKSDPSQLVLTVIAEGKDSNGTALTEVEGADTQRVVLTAPDARSTEPAECLLLADRTTKISVASITSQLWADRDKAIAARRDQTIRAWLREQSPFSGLSEGNVYCVDLTGGKAARCGAKLPPVNSAAFVWGKRGLGGTDWSMVAPPDTTWCACDGSFPRPANHDVAINVPSLPAGKSWGQWRRTAARVTIRMINRRTVGSVADQSVTLSPGSLAPAALSLGREYVLRVGLSGSELVILLEEPSVQMRFDDLFSDKPSPVVPDGVFDVTFDEPNVDEMLVADLAALPDHLLPKPMFSKMHARVSLAEESDELTVTTAGKPPQKVNFGDVFTLPAREENAIEPMLVIRRIKAPITTFVLPLLAALLLIAGMFAESNASGLTERYWLVTAAMSALLQYRFALATRDLVNGWSSESAIRIWIQNGAWVLAGPPAVGALVMFLRYRAEKRNKAAAPPGVAASPAPAPRTRRWSSAAPAGSPGVAFMPRLRSFGRRILDNWPSSLIWIVPLAACALVWIVGAPRTNAERMEVALTLTKTALAIVFGSWTAWFVFHRAKLGSGTSVGPGTIGRAALFSALYVIVRFLSYAGGSQEQIFGMRVDVVSLPVAAALLAAFTQYDAIGGQRWRAPAILTICAACFGVVAALHNDFGLLWLGAMAVALALPATFPESRYATFGAVVIFVIAFILPGIASDWFREAWRAVRQDRQTIAAGPKKITFSDELEVARERDYYRLLDANQPKLVESIPSQLAREVVIERERVRYQSLDGAWREPFRAEKREPAPWMGAGFLRGRSTIGDPTFIRAARSDYVYPTYVRAEFGTLGLLSVIALYVALFAGATASADGASPSRLGLWAAAIGVGTALFMIGGTERLFPFSGKWPLFVSFASMSDVALGIVLCALACAEEEG